MLLLLPDNAKLLALLKIKSQNITTAFPWSKYQTKTSNFCILVKLIDYLQISQITEWAFSLPIAFVVLKLLLIALPYKIPTL